MRTNPTALFVYNRVLPLALGVLLLCIAGCGAKQESAPNPPSTNAEAAQKGGTEAASSSSGEATAQADTEPSSKQPELDEMKKPDLNPKLEFSQKGATLNWEDSKGKTKMSASLREVRGDMRNNQVAAFDFSGKLYENGKLSSTMTAPRVVVDSDKQIITATGGVTLKIAQRNSLVKSSWMKYYAKQQRVIGNGGVKITTADGWTYEGAYFEMDVETGEFQLDSTAKGHKY